MSRSDEAMMSGVKRIVILAFEHVQALDVFGPAETFDIAGRFPGVDYAVDLVTPGGRRVRTSSGIEIGGAALDEEPLDTLVVAGGKGIRQAAADDAVIAWVRRASERARRTTSVCTGAFA